MNPQSSPPGRLDRTTQTLLKVGVGLTLVGTGWMLTTVLKGTEVEAESGDAWWWPVMLGTALIVAGFWRATRCWKGRP